MPTTYEAGRYEAQIVDQGFTQSKEKGTPAFWIEVQPKTYYGLGGLEDVSSGPTRTITWWLTERTIDFFVRDMRSLGYSGDDAFHDLNPNSPGYSHSFQGVAIECGMTPGSYTDRNGAKASAERWSLRTVGAGSRPPIDDSQVATLDRLFGAKFKSAASAGRGDGKANGRDAEKAFNDDHIPF